MQPASRTQPFPITAMSDVDWASEIDYEVLLLDLQYSWDLISFFGGPTSSVSLQDQRLKLSIANLLQKFSRFKIFWKNHLFLSPLLSWYATIKCCCYSTLSCLSHENEAYRDWCLLCSWPSVIQTKQLEVYNFPSLDQWTDVLTEPLPSDHFELLRHKLNVQVCLQNSLTLSLMA